MEHKLKILSRYYEAILQGKKTFEVRKDDRPFQEGDTLLLQETVTPNGCGYTGREMEVKVTYILRDSDYVKDGYCIMGIEIISTNKSRYYGNEPSRRITQVKELKEAKRLLKSAAKVLNTFMPCDDDICNECVHFGKCSQSNYDRNFKWLYADEALKLIGEDDNG